MFFASSRGVEFRLEMCTLVIVHICFYLSWVFLYGSGTIILSLCSKSSVIGAFFTLLVFLAVTSSYTVKFIVVDRSHCASGCFRSCVARSSLHCLTLASFAQPRI